MTAKDWFGVIVRVIGIWLIVTGIPNCLLAIMGDRDFFPSRGVWNWEVIRSAIWIVGGVILLRGGDMIVKFAYPAHSGSSQNGSAATGP